MHFSTPVAGLGAALLAGVAQAQYTPGMVYDASNFFQTFDFFTGPDPTEGFVSYVDGDTANSEGLAGTNNGSIFMGVDAVTMSPPAPGRKSVRVSSQASYTHGLFIADIAHMPGSICGTWPAYWMFGPNWPTSGEIDIIEGVNSATTNQMTLHTGPGLTISNEGSASGTTLVGGDCGADDGHTGCGQTTSDNQNYGDGFNSNGGGVYATEWTSDHISIWFFPRQSIPGDIVSGAPTPESWGNPTATFSGPIDTYFQNNNIIFDTTFCGSWAGQVWGDNSECAALAPTCEEYVGNNPTAFAEAFWTVNSIKVFQQGANTTSKRTVPQPWVA